MTPEQRARLEEYWAQVDAKREAEREQEAQIERIAEEYARNITQIGIEIDKAITAYAKIVLEQGKANTEEYQTELYYIVLEHIFAVSEKHLAEIIGCSWQTICNYRKKGILPQPLTIEQAHCNPKGERRYYDLCEAVRKIAKHKETIRAQRSASAEKQTRNAATGEYIKK